LKISLAVSIQYTKHLPTAKTTLTRSPFLRNFHELSNKRLKMSSAKAIQHRCDVLIMELEERKLSFLPKIDA